MAACIEQTPLITSLVDGELDAVNSALARIARPRASRDITVPIGAPVTSAISA